jgi:hypothetical protein
MFYLLTLLCQAGLSLHCGHDRMPLPPASYAEHKPYSGRMLMGSKFRADQFEIAYCLSQFVSFSNRGR